MNCIHLCVTVTKRNRTKVKKKKKKKNEVKKKDENAIENNITLISKEEREEKTKETIYNRESTSRLFLHKIVKIT